MPRQETNLINVLLIDPEGSLYSRLVNAPFIVNYSLYFSESYPDALPIAQSKGIQVIVADIGREKGIGLSLLETLKGFDSLLDIVIIGDPLPGEDIMELIHNGARDFLDKPIEIHKLERILNDIKDKKALRRDTFLLERKLEKKYEYNGIIGRSPYMLEIFSLIEKISRFFSSVLITGETGTGKEMVARAIYKSGGNRSKPMVICDCVSIPENLFESELFGYLKGAFTGADKDKPGLFEEADKGIIFLDELAEIPLSVQAKLLRILEYKQFRPLGSNQTKKVEVRIIAASNRDLKKAVREEKFREDLYHRLNKVEIHLPPLRERREDIPLLARHFISQQSRRIGKNIKGISRHVQKLFMKYDWPGNVRELENIIERAALLVKKEFIDLEDLPEHLRESIPSVAYVPFINRENLSTLDGLEKEYILYLLKVTGSNLRKTASILDISRTTLYNKLKKYDIPYG